jgi:hypothetical protein
LASAKFSLIASAHAATIEHAAHVVGRVRAEPGAWCVQVGVYREERAAREAAHVAHRVTVNGEPRIEPTVLHGRRAWRAQVAGLTAPEAQGACTVLVRHHTSCLVLRPEGREIASR